MLIKLKYGDITGIVDTFGGELISLTKDGVDYLWSGNAKFWSGRSPHLFPVVGTLKDGVTFIKNREITMKKHGFIRNSELKVLESTEDSVTLILKDNKETYKEYPFHFTFFVTHTLQPNGFTTTYQVVNDDEESMCFNIGGHVGIRCPLLPDESFSDYYIDFSNELTKGVYFPFDDNPIKRNSIASFLHNENKLNLNHSYFDYGPMIFDGVETNHLYLKSKKGEKGIHFIFEDFPVLALWTFGQKKAPYLCLEPWHGLPAMEDDSANFNEKPYCIILNPHKSKVLKYTLEIL